MATDRCTSSRATAGISPRSPASASSLGTRSTTRSMTMLEDERRSGGGAARLQLRLAAGTGRTFDKRRWEMASFTVGYWTA